MSDLDLARIVGGWATLVTCIMVALGSLFALYQLPVSYTHLTLPTNREV
mgnify:CR=1 FL=1